MFHRPDQLENIIQNLAGSLSVPVIAKPNAGMPTINDQGIAVYDMTPEYFGKSMKRLVDLGAPWSADAAEQILLILRHL